MPVTPPSMDTPSSFGMNSLLRQLVLMALQPPIRLDLLQQEDFQQPNMWAGRS
jgi:hypothetical protein